MGTPVESILVEGFKSIARAEVALAPLNVLIGANGSGKSNFISAFELLRRVSQTGLQRIVTERGGPERFLRNGRKLTKEFRLETRFSVGTWETVFFATDANQLVLTENTRGAAGYQGTGATPQFMQPESSLESAARRDPHGDAARIWAGVVGISSFHFHDVSREAAVKQPCSVTDNHALKHDAGNLAAILLRMREGSAAAYERVLKTVRLVAPFLRDFELRPANGFVSLGWFERGSDTLFDAHALSDGTLRFICLATMFFQPERPQLFVIDEPELGLHPAAIQVLTSLFRSVTREFGVQIVAATQSTVMVSQLTPEDILVVERGEQEGSTFRRLDEANLTGWLDGYSLGELWEKNILGGRPR
ncbi:MAG: AAA family ATPase [Archangium sp.]|nr:AAA family ATPase [Archangium sp.]